MKRRNEIWIFFLNVLIIFPLLVEFGSGNKFNSGGGSLQAARQLYYTCVEKEDSIDHTISLFKNLQEQERYKGLAKTYLGSLISLKGKFAIMPIKKYRYVKQGLALMDEGIGEDPDNLEARFIRGMTCYYLPFFFKRKSTALADFKVIVNNLKFVYKDYDPEMVINITRFLLDNIELTETEIQTVQQIQTRVTVNEN